jgi:ABC-2 type transport system ATP-binding protein
MEEADQLCGRVAIMDRGRILALDTPAELKRRVGADTIVKIKTTGDRNALAEVLRNAIKGITLARDVDGGL